MRTIAIAGAAALALLSACSNEAEGDDTDMATIDENGEPGADGVPLTGEAPGFEAVAPGTYQVTRAGGEVDSIEIHPGMTYSRVAADGTATGGSIFMRDGKTCFTVEGQDGENCFTDGPAQPDGSMQTTADNGNVSTVRRMSGDLEDAVDDATTAEPAAAQ